MGGGCTQCVLMHYVLIHYVYTYLYQCVRGGLMLMLRVPVLCMGRAPFVPVVFQARQNRTKKEQNM